MPQHDPERTITVPLFGGSTLDVSDQPIGGGDVYELVFLTWSPRDHSRPLTFAAERDDARRLRDALTYLLDGGELPEPVSIDQRARLEASARLRRRIVGVTA